MLKALMAPRGMVTAPNHLAAQAGCAVLRDGGHAVEATAVAAPIPVVYLHLSGIVGDRFALNDRPGRPLLGIPPGVAVASEAKLVVLDTTDREVIRNILSDLPMRHAFKPGETNMFAGIEEAAKVAKPWAPGRPS